MNPQPNGATAPTSAGGGGGNQDSPLAALATHLLRRQVQGAGGAVGLGGNLALRGGRGGAPAPPPPPSQVSLLGLPNMPTAQQLPLGQLQQQRERQQAQAFMLSALATAAPAPPQPAAAAAALPGGAQAALRLAISAAAASAGAGGGGGGIPDAAPSTSSASAPASAPASVATRGNPGGGAAAFRAHQISAAVSGAPSNHSHALVALAPGEGGDVAMKGREEEEEGGGGGGKRPAERKEETETTKSSSKKKKKKGAYVDASVRPDPPLPTSGQRRTARGGVTEPFPEKLHRLLRATDERGLRNVAGFFPHGRSFCIFEHNQFHKEVMKEYFPHGNIASLQRQLNLYGFTRINDGPEVGGYYHELFLEGRPALCTGIRRVVTKGKKKKGGRNGGKSNEQEARGKRKRDQDDDGNEDGSCDSDSDDEDDGRGWPDFSSMPPILTSEQAAAAEAECRRVATAEKMARDAAKALAAGVGNNGGGLLNPALGAFATDVLLREIAARLNNVGGGEGARFPPAVQQQQQQQQPTMPGLVASAGGPTTVGTPQVDTTSATVTALLSNPSVLHALLAAVANGSGGGGASSAGPAPVALVAQAPAPMPQQQQQQQQLFQLLTRLGQQNSAPGAGGQFFM